MLLLNGEQFVPTSTNEDQAIQRAHYKESIKSIRERYSKGGSNNMVTLVRRKEPKRNASGYLEETPPIIFPSKSYPEIQFAENDKRKGGALGGVETWAYSKDKPNRRVAGEDWEPSPKSIKIMGFSESYNMDTQIDLIYYLLYKSTKVYYPPAIAQGKPKKGDFIVEDKAREAKEKVDRERAAMRLKNAIMAPDVTYPLHSDDNLRKVAAAWGIDGSMDEHQSPDEIRIRLEHSVREADKNKKITGSGKGFDEFFEMIDFDDAVRQRAMIAFAIDHDIIKFDVSKLEYVYETDDLLVNVPAGRKHEPFHYLAEHLGREGNAKEWDLFKRAVVTKEYLEALSYGDLKWLARQHDISPAKKSADDLKGSLCEVYCG